MVEKRIVVVVVADNDGVDDRDYFEYSDFQKVLNLFRRLFNELFDEALSYIGSYCLAWMNPTRN